MVDFIYFQFSSHFNLIFIFWELGLEFNVTLHVTVTESHDHILQWKVVEGSGRNNIIQYI